jgi:hypothetical protein
MTPAVRKRAKNPTALQVVIDECADQFGTDAKFAAALGMAGAGFSRGYYKSSFGALTLFRLARLCGRSPVRILEIAGKTAMAAETAYFIASGTSRSGLTHEEREILRQFAALSREDKGIVRTLLNKLSR